MPFIRRKSVPAANSDEVRPRNRLSKPMTRKSPTSPRFAAGKQSPQSQSPHSSTSSQPSLEDIQRTLFRKGSIAQAKPHSLETRDDIIPKPTSPSSPKKNGIASLIMQFENAASASQLSLTNPATSLKPIPFLYGSKQLPLLHKEQYTSNRSNDQLWVYKPVSTLEHPADSMDQLADPYTVPQTRESSYHPGEATGKATIEDKAINGSYATIGQGQTSEFDINKPLPLASSTMETEDTQAQWILPPPPGRTETPASLDCRALGNLKLGSLHVVNGRTSPVLSELSRHLISQRLRDLSSEYADSTYSKEIGSETWEDENVVEAEDLEADEPRTPARSIFDTEPREMCTPIGHQIPNDTSMSPMVHTPIQTPDRTTMMAQAYMNELQGSPFSYGTISPASTGSVVNYQDNREVSPIDDLGPEPEVENRKQSFESAPPSVISAPSEVETVKTRDQVFTSALEYQAPKFEPPASPERGISPDSLRPNSLNAPSDRIDSGYNSATSIISFNPHDNNSNQVPLQINTAPTKEGSAADEEGSKAVSPKKESSPRKFGKFFSFRPPMKKSPATAPVVPTMSTIQLEPFVNLNLSPVTTRSEDVSKTKKKDKESLDKAAKVQKKLHKSRPNSRVREHEGIVVQRLASCESTLDIPAIPDVAIANLHLRSQQVPELERTFKSQDHIRSQPSILSLLTPIVDIRFPSPSPTFDDDDKLRSPRSEKKERGRMRSRSRSKSRRRSFLGIFKSENDTRREEPEFGKEDPMLSIADFGDVITSLGANPYHIAHSRPQTPDTLTCKVSGRRTNPRDISVNTPTKRASMTDEEASEFARRRSHSFGIHDEKGRREPFFNDRGGLPGKILSASMTDDDIPPIPPMPNRDELKRISMRHSLQSSQLSTPVQAQRSYEGTPSSERNLQHSPTPPPPAHSPQPPFIDHNFENEYPVEDEIEVAPPPPSHSPAPMDILPSPPPSHSPQPKNTTQDGSYSPWNAQARAWRVGRESAGDTLRSHRQSVDLRGGSGDTYTNGEVVEDYEEQAYPVIPPRHPGRNEWTYEGDGSWTPNHVSPEQFDSNLQIHRSQTWDNSSYDPHYHPYEEHQYMESSFQPMPQRHHTWNESHDYIVDDRPLHVSHHEGYESRQSNHMSHASNDSRLSFYSHHNCHIDRPFDPPPRMLSEFDDEYEYNDHYYTPKQSPLRGRTQDKQDYEYHEYQGYQFQPQYQNQWQQHFPPQHQRIYHETYSSSGRPMGNRYHRYESSTERSSQPSPIRFRRNPIVPPSLSSSETSLSSL